MDIDDIIGNYKLFIEGLDAGLVDSSIERSELAMMDHICYRVATNERYQELLEVLKTRCQFLGEAAINGRPIATFELPDYLRVASWTVPYLELPAPKSGAPYTEGLEHAEFVVIGSLDRFQQRHHELHFSYAGMSKIINPELGLKTPKMSVKFHEQPLGAVVRIEQRLSGREIEFRE